MRVLLVDHDSEALETITRAIRGVLELDCVTSKGDALLLLRQNTYDVLIACERAIDGSGLDLLGRTTRTAVPLKRIFAAAPERLQLLGPRLAPFKVQRTINYPIDLEELWLAIAQVTSGPNEETDGTIERVVLDERGIPAAGTVPRSPIPPRPPAPLGATPPPAAPAVASGAGRTATARLTQPVPEPMRAPPPPPRTSPQVARTTPAAPRRATAPPAPVVQTLAPMTATEPFPEWTPEAVAEDDFAEIAAQARFGVQQKASGEAARRKRQRVIAAGGIAVVVAAAIVLLIEKFYDPDARAREQAIAEQVARMQEKQKVTESLTMIEVEIEDAIMANELVVARQKLDELVTKEPNHPRVEFLKKSIERAEEIARLTPDATDKAAQGPTQAAVLPSGARPSSPRREVQNTPSRPAERVANRTPDRAVAPPRPQREASTPAAQRSFGAPITETRREPSIPLDAPINTPPTYTTRRQDNSFPGRTVEASDSASGRTAAPPAPATQQAAAPTAVVPAPANGAGTAVGPVPNTAPAPAPEPPPAVDIVPAKIVKRVMPLAPPGVNRKTTGYVVLRFNIGVNGRTSDIEILESEPKGVFDESAREAVRRWVYEPRKENGVAVAAPARARLVFDPTTN